MKALIDGPKVLLVHGMSIAGVDWYADRIFGKDEPSHQTPEQKSQLQAMWEEVPVERVDFGYGEKWAAAQEKLKEGAYSVMVICDLSEQDVMTSFESYLGPLLTAFVERGGWALFPTTEGSMIQKTLQRLFKTPWRGSGYYRTTWGVPPEAAERVAELFGTETPSYSAKATSIRNAGPDACFGVTTESRHESLAMRLAGETDASRKDAVSITSPEGLEEDFDVSIACRDVGRGKIAFFGDVNAEFETCLLIASFCRRGSELPSIDLADVIVTDRHLLSDMKMTTVGHVKGKGNDAFKRSDFEKALTYYKEALAIYGDRLGAKGFQRETKVTLLSNSAESYLRLKDYSNASDVATKALDIDPANVKARVRRVKALSQPLIDNDYELDGPDFVGDVEYAIEEIEQVTFQLSREDPPRDLFPDIRAIELTLKQMLKARTGEHYMGPF